MDAENNAVLSATKANLIRRVKDLIEEGADINRPDKYGRSPLHFAVEYNQMDMVEVLIGAGANVNIEDESGCTPLYTAVKCDSIEITKFLIGSGADVNRGDKVGWTPLYLAIGDKVGMIKVLLGAGADINVVDKYGKTPLDFASRLHRRTILRTLLIHIAKLEAARLYISENNLSEKTELLVLDNFCGIYLQHLERYKTEVKKLKKENKPLHEFLVESDSEKRITIWEKNEEVRSVVNYTKRLKSEYPKYSCMLIDRGNKVKKEIFLCNNKSLIDTLSTYYRIDIHDMTFLGIKKFIELHRYDFMQELGGSMELTLIDFIDFSDITRRPVPKLKVIAFGGIVQINV